MAAVKCPECELERTLGRPHSCFEEMKRKIKELRISMRCGQERELRMIKERERLLAEIERLKKD
jgi:hypothetical protein